MLRPYAKKEKHPMKYIVLHTRAGNFEKGAILTAKQITDSGASLEDWLRIGAVCEVGDAAIEATTGVDTTSQTVEQHQPIEKSLLKAADAKAQGLVLNAEGTHWVKDVPSKEGIADDWVLNKAGNAYVAPTDPDAAV